MASVKVVSMLMVLLFIFSIGCRKRMVKIQDVVRTTVNWEIVYQGRMIDMVLKLYLMGNAGPIAFQIVPRRFL
ncbi:hypothetical protein FNV43_RR21833 [Rhamnella rubrinervis]|uniref:Uncharacterized protein n=1 Tax=Rhamnella rubrinervis TaxID=2594499 RepID=A0A8K0DV12_9ROSA|nr:hypothetical protein FNV43_RR21833 [Rhamnella rubrinervis]